jgi:hypothetical protein
MAATAAGAATSAYGQYESGQAAKDMYNYRADVARKQAGIADRLAQGYIIPAGELNAQRVALNARANMGRTNVRAGAGNVQVGNIGPTTGSTAAVYMSQLATGRTEQGIQRSEAGRMAFGEEVKASGLEATAGIDVTAGAQSYMAGVTSAVGTAISGAGSVAGKWLDLAAATPSDLPPSGPSPMVNPDSPAGQQLYSASIYGG